MLEEVCHWGVGFEGLEASDAALAVLSVSYMQIKM